MTSATLPAPGTQGTVHGMDTGTTQAGRYTAQGYFRLVDEGLLAPDDRVELLDGLIVSMPPQAPRHASGVRRAQVVLADALRGKAVISSQLPFLAGTFSVPEPDFAVLPGRLEDYETRHPAKASLVVEVADASLAQDRLTKSRIYAGAAVPEYWIVNLRDRVVEWYADPDTELRVYRRNGRVGDDDRLPLLAFPDVAIHGRDLLPPPSPEF